MMPLNLDLFAQACYPPCEVFNAPTILSSELRPSSNLVSYCPPTFFVASSHVCATKHLYVLCIKLRYLHDLLDPTPVYVQAVVVPSPALRSRIRLPDFMFPTMPIQ